MNRFLNIFHKYHIVDESPWPIWCAFCLMCCAGGFGMSVHKFEDGIFFLFVFTIMCILISFTWWRDIIREGTYKGKHTSYVQRGLKRGMLLFIASEVMFFFAIFWSFFHSSLVPTIQLGGVWPPDGIDPFNPFGVPFLNTGILVLSGASITYAHHFLIAGKMWKIKEGFIYTLFLALSFTLLQFLEYLEAPFNISDSVYGAVFFMATGFHGFHVIIGTTFIFYCFYRLFLYQYSRQHHVGFEAAAWYWHFVDVVWLFLFVTVYIWGSI